MNDYDQRKIEEKIEAVGGWIQEISEHEIVGEMDTKLLREVLEEFGADFSEKPGMETLSKKYNLGRRPGMNAVWGVARMDAFNKWTTEYVLYYEAKTGRPLPVIENTETKTSGMRQFLGELTALASDHITPEEYLKKTGIRARKGKDWQERDISQPYIPTDHSSFPPGYAADAWKYIQASKVA